MPVETTVLLVEASTLPSSLEEQLTRRSVFAEHASQAQVPQVVPVVVPDLIIQSGKSQLLETIAALAQIENAPPLVVIADRATIRRLREESRTEVSALIPQDLPVAAIAHRIATMARRSSKGEALEHKAGAIPVRGPMSTLPGVGGHTPSMGPPAPPASEPAILEADGDDAPPRSKRGSLAPQPLAGHQSVKIFDAEVENKRAEDEAKRLLEEAESSRREKIQAAQAEAEDRRQKEQAARLKRADETKARQEALKAKRAEELALQKQRKEEAEVKRNQDLAARASQRAPAPSEKPAAKSVPPLAPKRASSTPPRRPSVAQSLASSSSYRPAPIFEPEEELPAATEQSPVRALREDDELSVVAPLPVDIRLALSAKSGERPVVRLALLDTDLTRADSVCAALRREGLEIFPVTPDVATTRWPMLRRFAPQGLVVDEKSMVRGAAEWVETFRGDLFLRHVPVVLMRFSRLFRDKSGSVDLEPLMKLIEPLGKEEFVLLQKLKPGRQVDLRSSQIPPFRLVQLLTEQDRNTRLDCQGGDERIVWPLGPGYAGKAKLLKAGSEKVLAKLSPEDAMSWLLSHDDCSIAVHEHSDPLAHPSQSQDSQLLLNEMTEAVGTPTRHESVAPGPGNTARTLSVPPASLENRAAQLLPLSEAELEPSLAHATPPSLAPDTPHAVSWSKAQSLAGRAQAISSVVQEKGKQAWRIYQASLLPLRSKIPERALFILSVALPLLAAAVVFAVIINLSSEGGDRAEEPANHASTIATPAASPSQADANEARRNAAAKPTKTKEAAEPSAPDNSATDKTDSSDSELWKVAPDSGMATCEEKLGPATPTSESPSRAIGYWKQARRLLMQGKSEEAMEMMCLAGLFDPAGPAAEGLAEYYLAQRALIEAERWVKLSLKADAHRRTSHELLGDIESQKGNPDEALKIWLDTMRLSGDEVATMQAISRKLMQDATLARRGGDLPRAERSLRRAAALSPQSAVVAAELAEIFLQRNALSGAENWAARARQLDANFSGAKILSGRIAEAAGKANEARDHYRSVPPGDPSYPQAQNRLEQVD